MTTYDLRSRPVHSSILQHIADDVNEARVRASEF